MITRSNPTVGYLDPRVFEEAGFTQTISATSGRTVYLSGIAPLAGDFELVADDMAGQLGFVLDILERCLQAEQLTWANLVALTIYVTDVDSYVANSEQVKKRFGETRPTSTLVGVSRLAHPRQMVEITATAAA